MTRLRAFALHLFATLAVLLAFTAWVRWVWYPGATFAAEGAWRILLLVVAATLALGPLLTLIASRVRGLGDASRGQVTGADLAVILLCCS